MNAMPDPNLQPPESAAHSPSWGSTTKLVVALSLVALAAALVVRFQNLVGPILVAFIFAYLVQPLADWIHRKLRLPWKLVVNLLYILLFLAFLGLLAWGGLALVEQVQSLIVLLQNAIKALPNFLDQLTTAHYVLGPFVFDFKTLDLQYWGNQLLNVVQPLLSNLGNVVGAIASGAVNLMVWGLFTFWLSYFIVGESGGVKERIISLRVPGYDRDLKMIGSELGRIWNAFLRGQMIIFVITYVIYAILLGALGVRYFYGLALLAGLARFVPYVGPFVAWMTYGLVAYFQGTTLFGMSPIAYALMVVGIAYVTDYVMDTFVTPRLMADALRVHPAAVMVAVLVGLNLLGVIGMLLAAPVLATVKLIFEYISLKFLDLDPWTNIVTEQAPPPPSPARRRLMRLGGYIQRKVERFFRNLRQRFSSH